MDYKTEISKRAYDGRFVVWQQMAAGYVQGEDPVDVHNSVHLQTPVWVVTGVYDTRGQAYRADTSKRKHSYRKSGASA